jgi:hypothetical protein
MNFGVFYEHEIPRPWAIEIVRSNGRGRPAEPLSACAALAIGHGRLRLTKLTFD